MILERWEIGSEIEEQLLAHLGTILKSMGFVLSDGWNAIAGSQDISQWQVTSAEGTLTIESETYIGLSVTGPAELIRRVRQQFEATDKKQGPAPNSKN
jgi:hypothetical protein